MVERYKPQEIEAKWQARWAADRLYEAVERPDWPKWYALTMFPYTSGDLHIGHWFAMAPSYAQARYRRMQGRNVLFPVGFDAFGLPAENAAIRGGTHPYDWTMANIERMRGQLKRMGAMSDWSREVATCDPSYYRWTQWWFLQLYRQGIAYRADLITVRLPGARSLEGALAAGPLDDARWAAIGRCLRRFHDAGVHHADLNARNVMLGDALEVWVLDFDRGRLRRPGPWRERVLDRLARSLAKSEKGPLDWQSGFEVLRRAHDA